MTNITLLTDFGLQDAAAGMVKGELLQAIPGAYITDISHEIAPFQIREAAYMLGSTYSSFAPGTVHLVLIDIFYKPLPVLALSRHQDQYFLTPDNGLLPIALSGPPQHSWLCFSATPQHRFQHWLSAAAHAIRGLPAHGGEVALPPYTLAGTPPAAQAMKNGTCTATVLYIDHYGNVTTDMSRARFNELNRNGRFRLRFMRVNEINSISTHYSDVLPGTQLCRFNRNGYLEICVNHGHAANLFGFRLNGWLNSIELTFE